MNIKTNAKQLADIAKKLGFQPTGSKVCETDGPTYYSLRKEHVAINIREMKVYGWSGKPRSTVHFKTRTSKGGYGILDGDAECKLVKDPYDVDIPTYEKVIKHLVATPPPKIVDRGKKAKLVLPDPHEFDLEEFTININQKRTSVRNNSVVLQAALLGVYAIDETTHQLHEAMEPGAEPWFLFQFNIQGRFYETTKYALTDGEKYYQSRMVYFPSKNKRIPKISENQDWVLGKGDLRILKRAIDAFCNNSGG